jgi:transmembrane sensor
MKADHQDALDAALDWLLRIQQSPEDGELRQQLAAWLASDSRHIDAYRRAERTWQITGQLSSPSAATATVPATVPRRPRRRRLHWLAGAVASGVLLLSYPQLQTAWQADYRTATAERRQLELPDGSTAVLDADSAIAIDFTQGRRSVSLLQGQAYFAVRKDTAHPFQVETPGLRVTVTGTAFNVDGRSHTVNVTHGSVEVGHAATARMALRAGQGARLAADGSLQPRNQPAAQVATWRQGRLIAREESIATVIEALRPYLSGKVLLLDQQLAGEIVSGVYDLADPHAALAAVLLPHQASARRITPFLTLIARD